MIRVAAITSGRDVPGSRYRIRQYLPHLRAHGIDATEFCPWISSSQGAPAAGLPRALTGPALGLLKATSRLPALVLGRRYDLTWMQRELIPGYFTLERLLKRPLVLDLDDASWLNFARGEADFERLCRTAELVIAGNRHIAEKTTACGARTVIIPTPVDTGRYRPAGSRREDPEEVVVGWIGSSSNFRQLEEIVEVLVRTIKSHPRLRLLLVADRDFAPLHDIGGQYEYARWSADTEIAMLQRMDIGIMPLRDEPWSLGKCSYKALQYMACGAAVIASNVGMNREVVTQGVSGFLVDDAPGWAEALHRLAGDPDTRRRFAQAGRDTVNARYSLAVNVPAVAAALLSV